MSLFGALNRILQFWQDARRLWSSKAVSKNNRRWFPVDRTWPLIESATSTPNRRAALQRTPKRLHDNDSALPARHQGCAFAEPSDGAIQVRFSDSGRPSTPMGAPLLSFGGAHANSENPTLRIARQLS
jgi:hypothetical protein